MRSTTLLVILFTFSFFRVQAQESIGIGISNYSPANSLLLNPSSISDSKAFMDIHLAGFSVFARNNLAFFPGGTGTALNPSGFNGAVPSYDLSKSSYRAYVDVLAQGPTITTQIGKHAFALYTGVRTVADVRGVGNRMATYVLEGFQYGPFIGEETRIRNLRATALSWAEVGFTYATILKQSGRQLITGGIHVKRLIGIAGAGFRLNDWHFTVEDSTLLTTENISGQYGFNEPAFNSGSGWGVDIGFTYKQTLKGVGNYVPHSKKSGCRTCDYKFKISVALLDLGRIKFNPEFYTNTFDEEEESDWENFEGANPDDVNGIANLISDNFSLLDEADKAQFRVILPAALSVQYDYNLGYNFFLNGSWVQGIPWKNSFGLQRPSLLSFTPRFEIKRFEAALPISLFEMRTPMLGAMLRLNSIIIGTDNLGGLIGNGDKYGADFYFHVKYTLFKTWGCRKVKERTSRAGKPSGKVVPCASW